MLLPHVSALCLADILWLKTQRDDGSPEEEDNACVTTSPHVVSVESEHPYRPATVSQYRYAFFNF